MRRETNDGLNRRTLFFPGMRLLISSLSNDLNHSASTINRLEDEPVIFRTRPDPLRTRIIANPLNTCAVRVLSFVRWSPPLLGDKLDLQVGIVVSAS